MKRLAALVAAGLFLVACGEPTGQMSGSGMAYTVTADAEYLQDSGMPVITAVAVCEGNNFWTRGETKNADLASRDDTVSVTVWCYPKRVIQGSWEVKHS